MVDHNSEVSTCGFCPYSNRIQRDTSILMRSVSTISLEYHCDNLCVVSLVQRCQFECRHAGFPLRLEVLLTACRSGIPESRFFVALFRSKFDLKPDPVAHFRHCRKEQGLIMSFVVICWRIFAYGIIAHPVS